MKKILTTVLVLALVLSLGAPALACGRHGGSRGGRCFYYQDANGDGICDHCQGVRPGTGSRCPGCGLGFTDLNGDGVCDFCAGYTRPSYGHSGGHHSSGHHGRQVIAA